MRHYRRLGQKTRLKTSVKIALVLAGSSLAGLAALLLIVFNLSKNEVSMAGSDPMIFLSADVIQDTTTALRGSSNNPVIGVVIETRGSFNPIKLLSIDFSANGTSLPVEKQIENARLWYTGAESNFTTFNQVGETWDVVPSHNFTVITGKTLQAGKNYFWLSFDVKADAAEKNGIIDAECLSLKIGVTDFLPLIAAPAGKKNIYNNFAFYSTGNKSAGNTETWNNKRDGSGIAPKNTIDSRYAFFIQSGHSVHVNKEISLPTMMVESGGTLNAGASMHLNSLIVACEGIYQQDAEVREQNGIGRLVVNNGGNYIHNHTGRIGAQQFEFYPKSTQTFLQYGINTFADYTEYGSVQVNSSQNLNLDIRHKFSRVMGDLEFRKTGVFYTEGNDTMDIRGNFVISGGSFAGVKGNDHILVIEVGKDYIQKNGTVKDASLQAKNSHTILNLNDDFIVMDGTFDFNNAVDGKSTINLVNIRNSKINWTQKKGSDVVLCNLNIRDEKEVTLKGEKMGDISQMRTITVDPGSKLMCGNYPVNGAGRFVLSDNSTLGIGHIKGINSKTPAGNILTGERFFSSSANYIYYSGSTPQETGEFSTAPVQNTVKNLVIRKDAPNQEVILLQPMNVTGNARVSMGSLNRNKFKLELSRLSKETENTAASGN